MFYKIGGPHGLLHDPFKSCVVPRPIGWISTIGADGAVNLAPYSFFNAVATEPPMVMFSSNGKQAHGTKDSVANEVTGEFVCNMATWELREAVDTSSQMVDPETDETVLASLETVPSRMVRPPRVAASPVHLECLFHSASVLPGYSPDNIAHPVIGQVIGVHVRDDALTADGRIDVARIRPLARLGYFDYTAVDKVFTMEPTGPGLAARRKGLAGEAMGRPKSEEEAAK